MNKILVTAYTDPDLDGTACAIAYAEFLQEQGKEAIVALFGKPHQEAKFVFQTFNIQPPPHAEELITSDTSVIIVDASDLAGISSQIKVEQVIEIIDHRKVHEADKFINAKAQIELVGSAATLIAEKFKLDNTPITSTSAALLYSAIISNTINFQANVTTDRDKQAAEWLLKYFTPPEDYIHTMFVSKSKFTGTLKEAIEHDFANFTFANKTIGFAQLEIVDAKKLIQESPEELKNIFEEIQKREKYNYIFLSAIDIEKATNTFFVIDDKTKKLVSEAVGVKFEGKVAERQGIMMRKTITPLLKSLLEKQTF